MQESLGLPWAFLGVPLTELGTRLVFFMRPLSKLCVSDAHLRVREKHELWCNLYRRTVYTFLVSQRESYKSVTCCKVVNNPFNLRTVTANRANHFLCYLFLFYVIGSFALTEGKTQKVLKCIWTTTQWKHLGSHVKQNNLYTVLPLKFVDLYN